MRKNSFAILLLDIPCVYTSRQSLKRGISEGNGKAVFQIKHLFNDP